MAKMKVAVCPAEGFTIKSPYGEEDVIKHLRLHAELHHPDMKNVKDEELMKMITNE
jgi:hypothetical protein